MPLPQHPQHGDSQHNPVSHNTTANEASANNTTATVRPVPKRLIVCCDGTWNEPSESSIAQSSTNVFKLSQAIPACDRQGVIQMVHYDRGLGTGNRWDKYIGGALGSGIDQAIQDAYLFLSMNYQPGDEIYLFGFSRGAYTVRSLAGFIYTAGLLEPQEMRCAPGVPQISKKRRLANRLEEAYHRFYRETNIKPSSPEAKSFRAQGANFGQVEIKLLCCWDTVGSIGIPDLLSFAPWNDAFNQRYGFHDYRLCSQIKYALHAVALDEKRSSFNVVPMEVPEGQNSHLEQVLFAGDHGCVGGGSVKTKSLANVALQWVLDRIDAIPQLGLEVDANKLGEPVDHHGRLSTSHPHEPIIYPKRSRKIKLLWAMLGLFSRGFKRQIPALSEPAITWLSDHSDRPLTQLKQAQDVRQQRLENSNNNSTDVRRITYDLHESVKARLLAEQVDYAPDSLGDCLQELLEVEGDRVFQTIQQKVATTV